MSQSRSATRAPATERCISVGKVNAKITAAQAVAVRTALAGIAVKS
jgi:hypothetical protein